jgi:hypothetical protein
MILSVVFSLLLVCSLWPYLAMLSIINLKKHRNEMETPLPGRPARRTIGRINDDMSRGILSIYAGYIVFTVAFYGTLNFSGLVSDTTLMGVCIVALAVVMFIVSPYNRQCHAYANLGHIIVIHLVTSLSAMIGFMALFYGAYADFAMMGGVCAMVLGAMCMFSRKVITPAPKKGEM